MNARSAHRQLCLVLRGGATRRFHSIPMLTQQTVADHSANVAWLCALLNQGTLRAELLLAALQHDLPEADVGDLPSPAKRRLSAEMRAALAKLERGVLARHDHTDYVAALFKQELRTLKVADVLEGLLRCAHEAQLGNSHIAVVAARYRRRSNSSLASLFRESTILRPWAPGMIWVGP